MADPLNRALVKHTSVARRSRPGETHQFVSIWGGSGGELLDLVEEEPGDFKVWVGKDDLGPTEDPHGDHPYPTLEWQVSERAAVTPELAVRNPANFVCFAHHGTECRYFLRFGAEPWI